KKADPYNRIGSSNGRDQNLIGVTQVKGGGFSRAHMELTPRCSIAAAGILPDHFHSEAITGTGVEPGSHECSLESRLLGQDAVEVNLSIDCWDTQIDARPIVAVLL